MTEIELDVPGSSPAEPSEPGGSPRAPLVVLVLVALLAVVVLVLRSPDPPADQPAGSDAAAAASSSIASSTTSIVSSTTVAEPIADEDAVLGELTGLELWTGGDVPVTRLDLDTGAITTLDFRAYPVLESGEWLVLYRPDERRYVAIDRRLAEPVAVPVPVSEDFVVDAVGRHDSAGNLWVAMHDDAMTTWQLVSLSLRGAVRSEVTETLRSNALPFGIAVTGGPLVDVRGDEVWRRTVDGFEPWFTGDVLAYEGERALVRFCEIDCSVEWRSVSTGARLAEPAPAVLFDEVELLGGGSWLHTRPLDSSQSLLVEVGTDRAIDTGLRVSARQFAVSPDGNWAAIPGAQLMRMIDLRTGESTRIIEIGSRVGTSSSSVLAERVVAAEP